MTRRLSSALLLVLAVGAALWLIGRQIDLSWVIAQEQALHQLVAEHPVTAFLAGFAVYLATSLVPGTGGKAIVCGWLFGFWAGLLIVDVALTAAAVMTFLAVRYFFREAVERNFAAWIGRLDRTLARNGGSYLLTLRLLHVPYTLINYTAGATAVPVRTFWWTTQLGVLPGSIAFVFAGSQLPTLQRLTTQGPWSVIDWPLLIGLSSIALVPVLSRWLIRRIEVGRNKAATRAAGTAQASKQHAP